jgi:integration host factor subunit beta
MTKSDLISLLASEQVSLSEPVVMLSVNAMLRKISEALAVGERIESRGFGSFTLRFSEPRFGRNPKTGEKVALPARYTPRFKPGKEMRDRVNAAAGA